MGSKDLHHKRKQQTLKQLQRKEAKLSPHDIVLIVCEGKKTEPHYLQDLRDDFKLNNANIKILGAGADPSKIIKAAINEFKINDYDRIYCVFDKDQHSQYESALKRIISLREHPNNPIPIYAINSVPCFEYWLLLHFEDTTRPYKGNKKGTSSAEQVISNLKQYIKNYKKGDGDIYEKTKPNQAIAIKRAKKNLKLQQNNNTDNPSTNFFELIEYLINLKN